MSGNKFEQTLKTMIPRIIRGVAKALQTNINMATNIFYTSKTYALLSDYGTGLWLQDENYIIGMLINEVQIASYCY